MPELNTPWFRGEINNGKFIAAAPNDIKKYVASLSDGAAALAIKRAYKTRTNPQNRYLWGVVYKWVADRTGYTKKQVHFSMGWEFLRIDGENGIPDTISSTRDLSTVEFEQYWQNIRQLHYDLFDEWIPLPNEVDLPEYPYL